MQLALVRVGTSVRLLTYDSWKKAITVTEQWACPRVFEREFLCKPTFENMAKYMGVEWYRVGGGGCGVDVGEEQEWLDQLELERSVFDNSGRRLWSGWIQHSIVAGGRKEIGLKLL
eukprot:2551718-Rhodomonas_salina.1